MSEKSVSYSGGVGFATLLTILFVGLKLAGYITWNWWWVLSPIWISWIAVLAILFIVGVIFLIVWIATP